MNISRPFIRRPVATTLLAAAVLFAGIAAFTQLPIAPLPRVEYPTVSVAGNLPGASPETMASAVATPLERHLGRIAGLTELTSTSTLGSTSLTLQFDLNRVVDAAIHDVQAAINAAGGELPSNLPFRPGYRKVNPADAPILVLALSSETLPLGQVYDQANTILAQKISQVEGVGQVSVGGGQQPAVRVQVDPEALAGVGLTLEDVRATLGRATVEQPKGAVGGPMVAHAIAANDQLLGAEAYRKLILSTQNGASVRLGDIATVVDDVENIRVAGWVDSRRALPVIIRRQPGANILAAIERIKAVLPSLAGSISPAIDVQIPLDRAQTIRASVEDVELSLVISVVLVVLVVFLFLRSGRVTLIPTVAVPLSLVGTFGAMFLLGYSLDNLSLMALSISTGFVVDDAIVVTENIARYIELGEAPLDAALKGARRIGFTIVSITISLLAVFIPILLMGGVPGRLFREFAITLSIAIAVSAIVSLTLTPMMCSRLLRRTEALTHGRFDEISQRAFDRLLRLYEHGLRWVLEHHSVMLLVTIFTIGLSVFLYAAVPKDIFPQQDTGQILGITDAPEDISFPAMKARSEALNAVVAEDPNVRHFVSLIGSGNTGTMIIELKPLSQRKTSSEEFIARLQPKLAQISGIKLFLQPVQDIYIGGRSARARYQYTLVGASLDQLNSWAPRMLGQLKGLPQLRDVSSDQQSAGLKLDITIDHETASRLGIQTRAIDDTLYDAYGQRQVATLFTHLNQYRVVLEVAPRFQAGPDSLTKLYVRSASGQPVPLSAFAKVAPASTPVSVNHQGQFPAVTLSFNVAAGSSLGEAVKAVKKAELDVGMPASVSGSFQGTAQVFEKALASEPWLILAALVAVYVVLGVLYESLIHPLTILSTLPSAGVGALVALFICRTPFTIIALIGVILLLGIVKKNAIMMVDFAVELERDEGLSTRDAIHKACLWRFRPILMTSMAAILGGLPLALGSGVGAELRRPLGITIVGGLAVSQLLTLYTTPVIYLALDQFSLRWRKRTDPRFAESCR